MDFHFPKNLSHAGVHGETSLRSPLHVVSCVGEVDLSSKNTATTYKNNISPTVSAINHGQKLAFFLIVQEQFGDFFLKFMGEKCHRRGDIRLFF